MNKWSVVAILAVAQFVMVLDSTVMNVSISQVVEDLDTDVPSLQLVITFYTLVMASFMLIGGKLGDLYGRLNIFRIGSIVYGVGSLVTGLSVNIGMLLVGWSFIEGLGAVMVIPAIAALVATNYQGRDRVAAYAIIGGVTGAAAAAGPLIGGYVTTYLSWRYVFFAETAIMAIVLVLGGRMKDSADRSDKPIDPLSAVLSVVGLFIVVYAMLQSKTWGWVTPRAKPEIFGEEVAPLGISLVAYLLVVGSLVLWLFFRRQRGLEERGANPLMRPSLLSIAQLRSGLGVVLGQQFVIASLFFALPIYLQLTLGLDALDTGIRMVPLSVALIIASLGGARVIAWFTPRNIVITGQALMALGVFILLGSVSLELKSVTFALGMSVTGAGMGFVVSQTGNINMSSVSESESGEVGGLQGVAQNLGSSLGTAIIGSLLIASLTTAFVGRVNESALPEPVKVFVNENTQAGIAVVTSDEVEDFAEEQGLSSDDARLVSDLYRDSQIEALRQSLFVIAAFGVLALPLAFGIPNRRLE